MSSIASIHTELLAIIFAYASPYTLPISRVCKSWRCIVTFDDYSHQDFLEQLAKTGDIKLTKWLREELFLLPPCFSIWAATYGQKELVTYLYHLEGDKWIVSPATAVSMSDNLEMMKWLIVPDDNSVSPCPLSIDARLVAAKNGSVQMWHLVREQVGSQGTDHDLELACDSGSREMIQAVLDLGVVLERDILYRLCDSDNIETFKWLLTLMVEDSFLNTLFPIACSSGAVQILEWLRQRGYWNNLHVWNNVAVKTAKYFLEHGVPFNHPRVLNTAAHRGDIEGVKWAIATLNVQSTRITQVNAVYSMNLDLIEFLGLDVGPGDVIPSSVCVFLSSQGQRGFGLLKWLQKRGAQFSQNICAMVAASGHLAHLKWLRAEGYAWGDDVWRNAAAKRHVHILKWLYRNGCPEIEELEEEELWRVVRCLGKSNVIRDTS